MKITFGFITATYIFATLLGCTSDNSDGTASPPTTAAVNDTPNEPYTIHHGSSPWPHWHHSDFNRPNFNWQWDKVKNVTCTAQDSRGHSYQVTDDGYNGQEYQSAIGKIEDSAIDRCYAESSRDAGCRLSDCNQRN